MKLVIFGATGMVGKYLTERALADGHRVRAFGRNVFTAGFAQHDHLELIKGALFDKDDVYHALRGSDAALSVIGGSIDPLDRTRSLGMENIVRQMQRADVQRIIAVGGMGVLEDRQGRLLLRQPGYPEEYKAVGEEHFRAYSHLKNSGLRWTFVCCPDIIPAPATGSRRVASEAMPEPNSFKIQAGDLAAFMIREVQECAFLRQRVGICN